MHKKSSETQDFFFLNMKVRYRKEDCETDSVGEDRRKMTGSLKSNFPINSIAN